MLNGWHICVYTCSEYVLITKPAGVEEVPRYRGIKSTLSPLYRHHSRHRSGESYSCEFVHDRTLTIFHFQTFLYTLTLFLLCTRYRAYKYLLFWYSSYLLFNEMSESHPIVHLSAISGLSTIFAWRQQVPRTRWCCLPGYTASHPRRLYS
jgi:hypothetical protein